MPVPFGDYNTTETVNVIFNTFSSDDPSASVTITNLAAADVEIHKDGGTTQRASDNGITVNVDFDSVTGNHSVDIDLSDNSDAGFYAAGSRYQVRIEGTTVDGGTINAWVGWFSIGCTLRPTIDGRTLGVESDGDLTKVNTLDGHTAQTGDTFGQLPTNFSSMGIEPDGHAHADVKQWTGQDVTGEVDLGLGFTFPAVSVAKITEANDATVGAIEDDYDGTGFDKSNSTIGTCTTNTDMRGTDSANTTIPDAAGTAATLHAATDLLINDIKAITDALGSSAANLLSTSANHMQIGTVDTATNGHTPTVTEFQADDITESTSGHYNGRVIIFTSGSLKYQATKIEGYSAVGGIGQFTVTSMTEPPANNDTFIIV